MKKFLSLLIAMTMTTIHALPTPPDVAKRPHTVESPFGSRQDEYYWLRDDTRQNPEILSYLNAENAYADAVLAPTKALQDKIYQEMVGRIKQDDSSVPSREHGWWYYSRYQEGKEYPIFARRPDKPEHNARTIEELNQKNDFSDEEILLNVNELAQNHDYYMAFYSDISKESHLMVWADDTNGRRQYTLHFKDLKTGAALPDTISGTSGEAIFVGDGRSVLYIEKDPETLLGKRVKLHHLGSTEPDRVIYEEKDDSFYMGLGVSRDEEYAFIYLASTLSNEQYYAPIKYPEKFTLFAKRAADVEYNADHFAGKWIITTNADGAKNFKIMTAADGKTERNDWQNWVEHNDQVLIEGVELFNDFTAIEERSEGLTRIRLLKTDDQNPQNHYIKTDESAYTMSLASNTEADSPWLRYFYTSMTTPTIVYEYNIHTGERRALKQEFVRGYDQNNYQTERVWVPARDGVQIPVSLVYRKGLKRDGRAPLLQYAYGSYGASMDPSFSSSIISLLDRGVVYALAHIRGGSEMGRSWYEDGKLLKKLNTFNDFVDVTHYLTAHHYADKNRVAAMGGSAGGLLMGAVANRAAADYRVIIAEVPFVDVVTTMLDETIPLTTNEFDEWGNPAASEESYRMMLSYSPYDNITEQAYPAMFIGTGLWDSQVQYWEPAKYTARLRDKNTSNYPIILRTNMEAGHGGKSGRFGSIRELAEIYAFMLDQLGIKE